MRTSNISRRAFLAGAGTVLASVTVPLAPVAAWADGAGDATGSAGSPATDAAGTDATTPSKIVIVATNDLHGTLANRRNKLGYAALKDYVAAQRELYGADLVTLADTGDVAQGGIANKLSDGAFPAQAMAAAGYDVAAPGNHDFDNGVEALVQSAEAKGLTLTCCNFTDATGTCVFSPYHVIEYPVGADAVRIAYVGVTTPQTRGSSERFKDADGNFIYDFAIDETGDALVGSVQAAVDGARNNAAADYVVLLAHLGQSWSPTIWRSDTIVSKTSGIDAVLDGHTHQLYAQAVANKDGQEVPVVQAGSKFAAFSRIEIDLAERTVSASAVASGVTGELVRSWDGEDTEVAALVDEFDEQMAEMTSERVGTSEVDLVALADDGTQATWLGETNLGDLVADAILSAAAAAGIPCDVAFHNSFGIFEDIAAGEITRGNVMAAFPFDNAVYTLEMSGQQLLDMLEAGCAMLPEPASCLLQPSGGFSYTVRTDIPTPVSHNDSGYKFAGIEGERRIMSATLSGQDVTADGRYAVAAPSGMLATGSLGMPVPDNADEAVELGHVNDILVRYIQEELGGAIGSQYGSATGAGRITVLDHVENGAGAGATNAGGSLAMATVTAAAVGAVAVATTKGE